MYRFLTLFFCCIAAVSVTAQKVIKVLSEFEQPLPFAYVHQIPLDLSKQAKVDVTNWDGIVSLHTYSDSMRLVISVNGYYDYSEKVLYSELLNETVIQLKQQPAEIEIVEITGELGAKSANEAMHKVTVIDKKRIEDQGAVTIRDVLSNETNIRIQQDNVLGASMTMQGISGENVKILIDGVPVIGRQGGNINLSQINLNDVERIEIIEGPLAVNYGTNAMAGTINIITKKKQDKTIQGNVSTFYETVGQYNANGQIGYKKGNIVSTISGGRNYFDGWSNTPERRFQEWNPKEQYFGRFQIGDHHGSSQWRFSTDYFQETIDNKGAPRAPLYITAFDDVYRTLRLNNMVSYKKSIKNKHVFKTILGYNFFERKKNTYFKDLTTLEQNLSNNAGDQDTTLFDLWMSRGTLEINTGGKRVVGQIGYDFNRESSRGERIEGEVKSIGDYALFGLLEWKPKKWLALRSGVRVAHNTLFQAPFIPSVNTKIRLDTNHVIKASIGRGFRAPSLKEMYFFFVDINHNIIGNPNLLAERGYNAQINYQWDFWEKHPSNLKTNIFYNHLDNMISLAQIGPNAEFTYVNIGQFISYGSQFDFNSKIKALEISVGGTLLATYNQLSKTNNVEAFNYSPEVRLNARYFWKKPKLTIASFYKYNGKMMGYYLDQNDEVKNSYISAFSISDVTVARKFLKNRLNIQIGIKNLFDVRNIQAQGSTGAHSSNTGISPMSWGRSFMIQSSFKF